MCGPSPRSQDAAEIFEAKGGRPRIYALDCAARLADELDADIVNRNASRLSDPHNEDGPAPSRKLYEKWKELDENEVHRLAVEPGRRLSGQDRDPLLRRQQDQR